MSLTVTVTLVVAMLSGLGVGSAGLLVAYLTLVEGTPQITAQAINLLFFLFSSGAALLIHTLRTRLLWRYILLLIPTGLLGSFLGVYLAGVLPQQLLRRLFGILLIISGSIALFVRRRRGE